MAIPFIDLCSGIGGFHSGLVNTGHYRCVGHAEIDKNAEKAYNAIYGEEGGLNYGDLRTINPRKLPHFDLLCGGFPCQSFSVAGRRLGFRDTRGTVFFEIARTVTSPPYADLIHKVVEDRTLRHKNSAFVSDNNATTNLYSDDERDLGNMPMDVYIKKVEFIMRELYRVTKPGGYNVWVVKDFRDTKNKIPYVDLHSKIVDAGQKAGFKYHDLIIWDQNQHRKLVLLGYPSVFYVNQNHSFIVVLRKI